MSADPLIAQDLNYSGRSALNRSGPLKEIGVGFWEGRLVGTHQYGCHRGRYSNSRYREKKTSRRFNQEHIIVEGTLDRTIKVISSLLSLLNVA